MDTHARLDAFEAMCEMVGEEATKTQVERLTSYALDAFGPALYMTVAEIGLQAGVKELYTEFSMRAGESGY